MKKKNSLPGICSYTVQINSTISSDEHVSYTGLKKHKTTVLLHINFILFFYLTLHSHKFLSASKLQALQLLKLGT